MSLVIQQPTGAGLTLAKDFTWNESVWNPSMIQTALWLDAADAATITTVSGGVSQWNDKSGLRRSAVQAIAGSRPVVSSAAQNGKDGVLFDGSNDFMDVSGGGAISAGFLFLVLNYARNNANSKWVGFSLDTTTSLSWIGNGNNGTVSWDAGVSSAYPLNNLTNTSGFAIHGITFTSTGLNAFANGSSAGAISYGTASINDTLLRIGARSWASSGYTNATYCEIIQGKSSLTTETRHKLEGYLAHKWGLTANLPAGHPYKTVGPTP